MLVETSKIISITRLQKELTQTVRKLDEDKQPVYIMKNNALAGVLIPFEKYEYLSSLEELVEHKEIYSMVNERLANYDEAKSVDWNSLK